MALIVDINGIRRLSLGKEEFVRGLNFGSKWHRLAIGIRMSVLTNVTFNAQNGSTDNRWHLGVCSGTTRTFYSYDTDYWLGINPNGASAVTTYTYADGGGSPYLYGTNGNTDRRYRTGNTTTSAGVVAYAEAVRMGCYDGIGDTLSTIFMSIVRYGAGASYYMQYMYPNQAQVQASYGADQFTWLSQVDYYAQSLHSGLSLGTPVGSPSITGVAAPMDSFSFVWNWDEYPALIRDLVVIRSS